MILIPCWPKQAPWPVHNHEHHDQTKTDTSPERIAIGLDQITGRPVRLETRYPFGDDKGWSMGLPPQASTCGSIGEWLV